jgi:hypothetical protein
MDERSEINNKNMIHKNNPLAESDLKAFLNLVDCKLPLGFIDFFRETNGADMETDNHYVILWPLTDMIGLNKDYKVDEYAPEFFIIGSDGGDTAYAIQKETGYIFELPFIGMANGEAVLKNQTFTEFVGSLK